MRKNGRFFWKPHFLGDGFFRCLIEKPNFRWKWGLAPEVDVLGAYDDADVLHLSMNFTTVRNSLTILDHIGTATQLKDFTKSDPKSLSSKSTSSKFFYFSASLSMAMTLWPLLKKPSHLHSGRASPNELHQTSQHICACVWDYDLGQWHNPLLFSMLHGLFLVIYSVEKVCPKNSAEKKNI